MRTHAGVQPRVSRRGSKLEIPFEEEQATPDADEAEAEAEAQPTLSTYNVATHSACNEHRGRCNTHRATQPSAAASPGADRRRRVGVEVPSQSRRYPIRARRACAARPRCADRVGERR